jgi:hypothetical protein
MLFLFNYKSNITLNHIWTLFALSLKMNLLVRSHTTLYFNFKYFLLLYHSLTMTCWTLFCKDLAFSFTSVARLLHLHLHHTHIYILNYLTLPLTSWTCFKVSTISTRPFAFRTINIPRYPII